VILHRSGPVRRCIEPRDAGRHADAGYGEGNVGAVAPAPMQLKRSPHPSHHDPKRQESSRSTSPFLLTHENAKPLNEVKQFWHDWHPSSSHIIFDGYATLAMVRQNGSFRMSRPRFQRTVQNPLGMPGAAVIAATIAVAALANGAICTAVHAQQRDSVDQRRLEAPIGHRQPRPQDVPSRAPQDENNARDVNRNFNVSPEINICRGC
jgi:hypothetical protein